MITCTCPARVLQKGEMTRSSRQVDRTVSTEHLRKSTVEHSKTPADLQAIGRTVAQTVVCPRSSLSPVSWRAGPGTEERQIILSAQRHDRVQ